MKISAVRLFEVVGELEFEGEFWEERLVMPLDVYQPYRDEHRASHRPEKDGKYEMRSVFVRIETDDGVYGIGGPATHEQASIIATQMARYLVGQDPFAIELIWDTIYRAQIHGRKGPSMMALSVVDCALWDLKGKALRQPVYRLLGGPTRESIPAYASALGYAVTPERAAERAAQLKKDGWQATKWFFRHGPGSGKPGIEKNVEMVRALRGALGQEIDLMLDAWNSWDLPYAVQVGKRIAQFEPRWIEEPTLPDKINVYAEIRRALNGMGIPVSGGEHEYTRWGLKQYMDAGAVDVLQPDIYWCGGITETLKIGALASTYDLPMIPHGHSTPATCHVIASQPPALYPLLEYLIKWNTVHQFFLKTPVHPERGQVRVSQLDQPGIGMELDEAKIRERRELAF